MANVGLQASSLSKRKKDEALKAGQANVLIQRNIVFEKQWLWRHLTEIVDGRIAGGKPEVTGWGERESEGRGGREGELEKGDGLFSWHIPPKHIRANIHKPDIPLLVDDQLGKRGGTSLDGWHWQFGQAVGCRIEHAESTRRRF